MAQLTKATTLRKELEKHLMTLKRNLENVSLELLKTRYATGYNALCSNIKQTASAYLKETVLYGIRIHIRKDYAAEGIALIQKCIDDSGLLKQLSKAAFHNQNIAEFDTLAAKLREKILMELNDFYYQHPGLYFSSRCMEAPYLPTASCNDIIWRRTLQMQSQMLHKTHPCVFILVIWKNSRNY